MTVSEPEPPAGAGGPTSHVSASSSPAGQDPAPRGFPGQLRHDLRTPLNAIIGYSEMLMEDAAERGEAAAGLLADLRAIHAAGQELLAIVNTILDPAAVEARSVDEVAARLRHELRAPLGVVLGHAEIGLAQAEALGAEAAISDLRKVRAAVRRFLALAQATGRSDPVESGGGEVPSPGPGAAARAEAAAAPGGVLLVVDDNAVNRDLLSRRLRRQGHEVHVAGAGPRALEMLRSRAFDVALLDLMMPGMDGYEVLCAMKAEPSLRDIPVIMISALDEIESIVRCIEMGAEDYLPKPFDPVLLRARIGASLGKKRLRDKEVEHLHQVARVTAAAAVEANAFRLGTLNEVASRGDALGQLARVFQGLFHDLQRSNAELEQAYEATLEGWARALELRDHETEGHCRRVTEMTVRLARALGLSEAELVHVRRGALLHDIGKMGVPDAVLLKPGPLTDDEWAVMRRHPVLAHEMLSPIGYLRPALDIPYAHHERWDGTGYPRGLRGEAVPLAARMFAIVDVWDALSSDRPYRRVWPPERVMAELRAQSGKHFDPRVVEAFVDLLQG